MLLKELDLVDFTPSDENISIKSFKDSYELNELSPDGVYRVLLIGAKNSIFLKHHPLKFSRSKQTKFISSTDSACLKKSTMVFRTMV